MTFLERIESMIPCRPEFRVEAAPCEFNIMGMLEAGRRGHGLPGLAGTLSGLLPALDLFDPLERIGNGIVNAMRIYEEELEQRTARGRGMSPYGSGGYGDGSGYSPGNEDDSEESRSYYPGGGSGEPSPYHRQGGGEPLGPGEQVQARQLLDYFVEKGFTPEQACGILGNMQTESNFSTNAYNPGEGAIGLCQWEGGRRTQLENFAAQQGRPVTDWRVQAAFVVHELTGGEGGAFASLRRCRTPQQAAMVFQSQYERSAALTNRAENASNIYNELNTQRV